MPRIRALNHNHAMISEKKRPLNPANAPRQLRDWVMPPIPERKNAHAAPGRQPEGGVS